MPKKMKKPRMIRMRATKEKKEKDKNKIKQSVKINITTSGGGSGGSGVPSIPTPIYNSMQGQKTGENVETHNLLKQLIQKQQPIIQPIYQAPMRQQIFDDEIQPRVLERDLTDYSNETLLQTVNRDNNIDVLEKVNRDDIDEQEDFINAPNISNESQTNLEIQTTKQLNDLKEYNDRNINRQLPLGVTYDGSLVGPNKFKARYKKQHIGTYLTPEEAASNYTEMVNKYSQLTEKQFQSQMREIKKNMKGK